MPTTMNLSDCQFEHSIGSIVNYWWYAIQVHAAYVVLGGVPLGGLLFYVVTSTSSWCSSPTMRRLLSVLVAVAAAASVPLYWNYYSKKLITTADDADHDYDDRGGIRWMGPFLASTFGFSTFFKAINAGFQQYPSGADANEQQTTTTTSKPLSIDHHLSFNAPLLLFYLLHTLHYSFITFLSLILISFI